MKFIYLLFLVPKRFPSALSMHTSPSTNTFLIWCLSYNMLMSWLEAPLIDTTANLISHILLAKICASADTKIPLDFS